MLLVRYILHLPNNYYVSKLFDSSKVVHDIGTANMVKGAATGTINTTGSPQVYTNSIAAIGYNHYETIHDTDNDTLILFNGSTASGLPSTYTATDSVTNLFYTFNLDPHYEASINCCLSPVGNGLCAVPPVPPRRRDGRNGT